MTKNKTGLKILFILLLVLISLSGIFSHNLWKPDEPRVAEIGREMWLNHQYVIPTLNKEPFLEKPPLYWWVMTVSYHFFGVSDGTARLPSALFGFLTLFFTYLIGKRVADEKTGMLAALVLATVTEFSIISHRCLVDNALFFFATLGYYGFFTGFYSENKRAKWVGYELMAVASGLAFLSKGVVGPGLIVIPPLIVLIASGNFREIREITPQIGVGAILFLAIVAPWIIGLYLKGGEQAIQEYLLQNTLGRMLPSAITHYAGGHKHSFFYYFAKLPQDFIPWIAALPASLFLLIHPPQSMERPVRKGLINALILFAGGFLLLSLPGTKRGLYLLPLYPLLAVVVGGWLAHLEDTKAHTSRLERYTLYVVFGLLAFVPLGLALGSAFIVATGIGPRGVPMVPVIARLTPLLPLIVPFGIIGFLYLGYKLLQSVRTRSLPSRFLLFTTAILCLLAYHEGATRVMDSAKNIHLFTNKIKPYLKADLPITCFQDNEVIRAIIPFDTGRYPRSFERPEDMVRFLQNHSKALVVIKKGRLNTLADLSKTQLQFLVEQDYSRHFKVCLYRWRSTPEEASPPLIEPGKKNPLATTGKPLI